MKSPAFSTLVRHLAVAALVATASLLSAAPGDPDDARTTFGPRPIYAAGTRPAVVVDDFGWIDHTWSQQARDQAAAAIAEWQAQGIRYAAYFAHGAVETDANDSWGPEYFAVDLDGTVTTFPVFTRSAYRQYLIASGKLAADLGATYFLLDTAAPDLPAISFDDEVIAGFRTYLQANYSPAELTAMGVTDVATFDYRDHLRSPAGGGYTDSASFAGNPPNDDLYRAWLAHIRATERAFFTEWTTAIGDYASTTHGRPAWFGANRYINHRQWDNIDVLDFGMAETFLDSLGYPYRNLEHVYKNAQNFGKRFWSWNFPANTGSLNGSNDPFGPLHITELSKIFAADTFSCGGLYQIPNDWVAYHNYGERLTALAPILRFPEAHPELFNLTRAGEVAVVYNEAYEEADPGGYTKGYRGIIKLLAEVHRPADVLFAGHPGRRDGTDPFATADLSRYAAIILPRARMLTDAQVSKIETYLNNGGVVIGLGQVADLDENGADRSAARTLDDYFGSDATATVGSGKVIAFAANLGADYDTNAATANGSLWEVTPSNATALQAARDSWTAAVDPVLAPAVDTTLPATVHMHRYEMTDGSHVYHLVNHDITLPADPDTQVIQPAPAATVTVDIPSGFTSSSVHVSWMSVDAPAPVELTFTASGDRITFTLPSFAVWGALQIGSAAAAPQAIDYAPQANFNLLADTGGNRPDKLDANGDIAFNYWYWKGGNHGTVPWDIPFFATDDNGVDLIRLDYRFSADGATWGAWTRHSVTDVDGTDVAGAISFNAPDGEGHYQFRIQAVDTSGNEEPIIDRDETGYGVDTTKPQPPANVVESGGHRDGTWISDPETLAFSWDPPEDNLSGPGSANVSIDSDSATIAATTLTAGQNSWAPGAMSGLTAGTRYKLHYRCEDLAGNWGDTVTLFAFYYGTAPIAEPTDAAAVAGDSSIQVSWTNPDNPAFSHVKVWYKPAATPYADWTSAGITPDASTTSYQITGLTNGTAYLVRLNAITTGGQPSNDLVLPDPVTPEAGSGGSGGGGSGGSSQPPAAPANLTATDNGANVRLTWQDQSDDETSFEIEHSVVGGEDWTLIATLPADSQSFVHNIDIGSLTHVYRVRAINAAGASIYSAPVSITRSGGGGQPSTHQVTVAASPAGSGTVTGAGTYNHGQQIQLQANPSAGYKFSHWSGDAIGFQNPVTVTVNDDLAITAHFVEDTKPPDPTPPPTPSAPILTEATLSSVSFSWTVGEGTLTGFAIERRPSGGTWSRRGEVGATARSFTDGDLHPGWIGEYRVIALGADATSANGPSTFVEIPSPEGHYFGTFPEGAGRFAAIIHDGGSVECLVAIDAADQLLDAGAITLGGDGSFTTTLPGDITLSGAVTLTAEGTTLSLSVTSPQGNFLGEAVLEPALETTAAAPQIYHGPAGTGLDLGLIHIVIAPSGRCLIALENADGVIESALGEVSGANTFSADMPTMGSVTATYHTDSHLLTGTIQAAPDRQMAFSAVTEGSLIERDRIANISTRGPASAGTGNMIGGFVITGDGPKAILVTAKGPSLRPFGIANALADPNLTILRQVGTSNETIHTSSSWRDEPNANAIEATGYAPTDDAEAAALLMLEPGAYTAVIGSDIAGAASGVSIVEVYEIDDPAAPSTSRLINISTRGLVGSDENQMIAGLVITGTLPKTVLITAKGPFLEPFGIANYLPDPKVDLIRIGETSETVASNTDWELRPEAAAIAATGYGPTEPTEAAMLVTLEPGIYTAVVSSQTPLPAGETRVAIVEAYEIEN